MRGSEDITVHPHTGQDWEGVDTYGEPILLKKAGIPWPRTSDELEAGGVSIGENVFIPGNAGEFIAAQDNVTLRGQRYAVDGKPQDIRKNARRKGILLTLKGIQV